MTSKQQRDLHARLAPTVTEVNPSTGLPICDDLQVAMRRGIIAQWEKERKAKSSKRK